MTVCVAHAAATAAYNDACRAWAETETQRLWAPVEMWQVRYAPIGLTSWPTDDDEGESLIQEIVTLDAPADIVAQGLGAKVYRVAPDGKVQDLVIGAVPDANPWAPTNQM